MEPETSRFDALWQVVLVWLISWAGVALIWIFADWHHLHARREGTTETQISAKSWVVTCGLMGIGGGAATYDLWRVIVEPLGDGWAMIMGMVHPWIVFAVSTTVTKHLGRWRN